MIFDPVDFLHSFARWIVARAAARPTPLTIVYRGNATLADGAQLWILGVDESSAPAVADPYTVLTPYGGPGLDQPADRINKMNLQAQTIGRGNVAAARASFNVFRSIFAADSRDTAGTIGGDGAAVRSVTMPGVLFADDSSDGTYTLVYVNAKQQPGQTGRDANRKAIWTFNMEIGVQR